jgi:hypothetical protein
VLPSGEKNSVVKGEKCGHVPGFGGRSGISFPASFFTVNIHNIHMRGTL